MPARCLCLESQCETGRRQILQAVGYCNTPAQVMNQLTRHIYLCLLVCFTSLVGLAQDIHLTQLYAMPTYVNPAFAGSNVCGRFTLSYRDQWKGFDGGYKTKMAGFDHSLGQSAWGIGALVV